jgi:glyoxalase family protein
VIETVVVTTIASEEELMNTPIPGLHHVTAIATDAQTNLDFYAGVLGLRLVKRTVNFDDPGTYHLYYGDESGRPGSLLTFFPWPFARRGSRGTGQATVTAFSVPAGSLGWWRRRLEGLGIVVEDPHRRFDEEAMALLDPDGMKLELVAHAGAGERAPWADGPVAEGYAVRGLHSVTLTEGELERTATLLTAGMGLRAAGEEGARHRFSAAAAEAGTAEADAGTQVDVVHSPGTAPGHVAAGTVHHVAWRTAGDGEQLAWRERLLARGLHVTPVQERQYFRSIYFREPGGVLFEIATDGPGFATDETVAALGDALKLPPWLEAHRARIEEALPPLAAPAPVAPAAEVER